MFHNASLPPVRSAHDILQYLAREYDPRQVYAPLSRAASAAWYMDQSLISMRIKEWANSRTPSDLILRRMMPIYDRVDRSYWRVVSIRGVPHDLFHCIQ